jgi:hypothetical protein
MEMMPVKPERKAELEEYARRHAQDTTTALDDVLAAYLEWERQDYEEAVQGIQQGYDDVRTARTQPANETFDELRLKHGFPR